MGTIKPFKHIGQMVVEFGNTCNVKSTHDYL